MQTKLEEALAMAAAWKRNDELNKLAQAKMDSEKK